MVVATEVLVALVVLAFLGGIIVATIGPGGILIVTGLYLMTSLSSAEVAGTSSAVFTIGAVLGSLIYARSGEIDWWIAGVVSAAAAAGTWVGVQANAYLSRALYGIVLAVLLAIVGVTIVYQEYHDLEPRVELGRGGWDTAGFVAVGIVIGVAGGLLGIGGAALSAPALVLVGVPMLATIAITQVVVVATALFTTLNYVLLDAIVTSLFVPITLSYLGGVGIGWWLAHRAEPGRLKLTLGVALIGLAGSLVV
ncbi:sulfite exporter TauE/SafE family protein [Natronococcus occultus]|uniref:Probable membrane transporter protein n=1 Tax=Natronococcus occultus SP4 TaxID=694430 RepID=L0K4G0_9EURY|nr:sulfite exporter TauE/SafE family protein [Natronococcus occultus]AGB39254.1 putative permease [Natronococcus occultus SP4]